MTTAEIIDEHGREVIEALAADGSTPAAVVLELADEGEGLDADDE